MALSPKMKRAVSVIVIASIMVVVIVLVPVIIATSSDSSSNSEQKPPKKPDEKLPFDLNKLSEEEKSRINCFLEGESRFEKLTQYQCEEVRGCIYNVSQYQTVPDCYFNRTRLGYTMSLQVSPTEYHLIRSPEVKAPYLGEIENLKLTVRYLGKNIINVKIVDLDNKRYEVPFQLNGGAESSADDSLGQFTKSEEEGELFSFKITRKGDNFVLFDSSNGAFVYNDQFLQISTQLANKFVYGFGENNHKNLLHDLDKYTSWGMFARDNAPGWGDNRNNYGFQPVYMGLEPESGKSHIVLLYNSNAMECLFTPSKSLTLRTIGGVLDFYFVLGDSPDDAIQHYHNLIGKPFFPPYWSLGFQISRWGYNKLDDVKAVVKRTREAKIPQDVQYIDIEYMIGYRILTINQLNFSGLSDFQKELSKDGIKLVLIQDPGVVMEKNNSIYMNGKFADIYIKWPAGLEPYDKDQLNTGDMISWCWPNAKIVYPDYMNGQTHWWWRDEIAQFMSNTDGNGTDIAGLWIDMNEPSSFETNERKPWNWLYPENDQDRYPYFTLKCPTNKYDDPPYRTKGAFVFDDDNLLAENKKARLSQKTLCMIAQHRYNGELYYHYDVHNLYGHTQAIATFNALQDVKPDKRPFSLTRSNFVGSGTYAAHWLGDNDSTWEHMKMSIVGSIEYNIFGMTMIGADICGFFRDVSDAEMCTRWIQLGAFSTFSRNHNANQNVDKDPAYFNDTTLTRSTRDVLKIRYELLPHMYTLLYHAHINGGSVMKALFFEFPKDNETYAIDDQLLLGKSLLISPVLQPKKTSVRAYLPPGAIWYDFRTGKRVDNLGWVELSAPLDYINVHLRGGAVLPTQELNDCLNTECSRKNKLGLIVSLDEESKAEGSLFWDDGFKPLNSQSFTVATFAYENNKLTIKVEKDGYKEMGELKTIKIYGLKITIKSVHLDGVALNPIKIENNPDSAIITTDISLKSIPSTGTVIEFKA